MGYQNIFKGTYVEALRRGVSDGSLIDYYTSTSSVFEYDRSKVFFIPGINEPDNLDIKNPTSEGYFDAENAIALHRAFRDLTLLQASDIRLWTYLAHVDLYEYMVLRWPAVRKGVAKDPSKYVLSHWFINSATQSNLLRHGISGLWWAAHLTYDQERENPYELTRILYRHLDFATRTLGTYKLSRYKPAVLGILEFIQENPAIFDDKFEAKQRFVTRYLNQLGGVKPLPYYDKNYFKEVLQKTSWRIDAL